MSLLPALSDSNDSGLLPAAHLRRRGTSEAPERRRTAMAATARAEEYKAKGNAAFQRGELVKAESWYSQAIICDSTNPSFFTNRALVRSKLEQWEGTSVDCRKALELAPNNLKAHHFLGLALLRMGMPNEALKHTQEAYRLAILQRSPSAPQIVTMILEAKKARWEAMEKQRISSETQLLEELCQNLLEKGMLEKEEVRKNAEGQQISEEILNDELAAIDSDTDRKIARLRDVFAMSDEKYRIRLVPEYLLDSITFTIMTDPVVTKHGQSYDRATILEHLRRSKTDPLTREPMTEDDLRPNLALKEACEDFLDKNGWAVDY